MLISQAFAQETVADTSTTATTEAPGANAPAMPSPTAAFASNMGLVLMLVLMFYILLIRPQQKRFKEHSQMLSGLAKGDKVVTGGGLIGTIEEITGNDEVIVNLGNGLKVTALRSTIHGKDSPLLRQAPVNDKKGANKDAAKK
mgnify:CR=1 FL=1